MTNDPAPARGGTDPRWRPSPTKIVVGVLLLIGIVVPLLVGTYAQVEPRFLGFPFFYWYQLLWVFIAAGLCGLSYVLLKRERDRFSRGASAGSSEGSSRRSGDGHERAHDGAKDGATDGDAR